MTPGASPALAKSIRWIEDRRESPPRHCDRRSTADGGLSHYLTAYNMNLLFLDFETFSYADLHKVGAYRYAEDPSTEVLCCAYAYNDGRVFLYVPDKDSGWIGDEWLMPYTRFVAHNCEFERNILRHKCSIDQPVNAFADTAAMAARMSLPRSLADLADYFRLDATAKLAADVNHKGDSVCRPRKPSKSNSDTRWFPSTKPEAFAALYERCKQDVELTREIYHKLLPLEEKERKIWQCTLAMNERGVRVDLDSIPAARAVMLGESAPMIEEFQAITGCKLKSYSKVAEALGLPDVRKTTVRHALRNTALPDRTRRALTILQQLSKSSVAKLDAMESRAHSDRRVRGSFLYSGAERTLRWSSSGVQFQNFKRGLGHETEAAFQALKSGSLDLVFTGAVRPSPDAALTPTGTVSEMLRGFILGPFVIGDLAQIEARVLAWLSGDDTQLDMFRTHGDPYCAMASVIYGREISEKMKNERFVGKQAELGCGYGLGSGGFIRMLDEIYDVQIEEEFSKRVVNAYRARHPRIVKFWDRLGKGFVHVVANKSKKVRLTDHLFAGTFEHGGRSYAYIELPSGRRMYYADPKISSTPKGPCVEYFGRDRFSGGWNHIHTYGGKLAENVTQAVSRDIIAESILNLEAAGFRLVMTVHDEIVAEEPAEKLNQFKEIMERAPVWAKGLPIEVDTFSTMRYRK